MEQLTLDLQRAAEELQNIKKEREEEEQINRGLLEDMAAEMRKLNEEKINKEEEMRIKEEEFAAERNKEDSEDEKANLLIALKAWVYKVPYQVC